MRKSPVAFVVFSLLLFVASLVASPLTSMRYVLHAGAVIFVVAAAVASLVVAVSERRNRPLWFFSILNLIAAAIFVSFVQYSSQESIDYADIGGPIYVSVLWVIIAILTAGSTWAAYDRRTGSVK